MATADKLEWPKGTPLFELAFRAVSEGMNGVGVLASGDMEVTATATANEISVGTGDLWVPDSTYTIGSAETHTLSDNTSGSDRWDTVVFDTGTGASAVKEGTAGADPEPPDLASGEILLGYVYVPDGATDTPGSRIYNWRAMSTDAADVRLDDSAGDFQNSNVEDALTEVIREAGDPLNGTLDLSSFSGPTVLDLGTNPGAFGAIADLTVDGNAAADSEQSYGFALNGSDLLKVYAEADGTGGVQNVRLDVVGTPIYDGTTQIWDPSADEILQAVLGGPASSLNAYPLELSNDTDRDLDGADLNDSAGPGTLYDASAGEFVRGVIDKNKTTTVVSSTSYITSGEELVLVDTSATGGAATITLSSADTESGRDIQVVDIGGNASTNPITVDTESTETINGGSSESITTNYTGRVFVSGGTNWTTTAPAPLLPERQVEGTESGAVTAGNQGILISDSLADGETLEITKAIFHLATGEPAPSSLNLIIATLDNAGAYTSRTTIYSGDGATVWDGDPANSIGSPLASWQNNTGGRLTVAVLVDNQTASDQTILAKITGERV